jgi:hypothetical protein
MAYDVSYLVLNKTHPIFGKTRGFKTFVRTELLVSQYHPFCCLFRQITGRVTSQLNIVG